MRLSTNLSIYFIALILLFCSISISHAGECLSENKDFINTIQTSDNLNDIEYALDCMGHRSLNRHVIPQNTLNKWLSSNNIEFKILGLRHLRVYLSDPKYVDILFQYSNNPDGRLRAVAAQMLLFIKNNDSLHSLIELTKDKDPAVVQQAMLSLVEVGTVDKDKTLQRTREMFKLLTHNINDESNWYLFKRIIDLLDKYGTEKDYSDFVISINIKDRFRSYSIPYVLQICKLNYNLHDMIYPLLMDTFPSEPNLEWKALMLDCLIDQMSLIAGKEEFVEKDLLKFPKRYLQYLRNSIFARHGKEFNSQLLKAYFSQKSWYKYNQVYTDSLLNDLEKKNIAKVKRIELEEKTYQKEFEALIKGELKTFVHNVAITGYLKNLKFIPKSNMLVFSEAKEKENYEEWNLWFIDIASGNITMKLDGCGEYFEFSKDGKYLITTCQFFSNNDHEYGERFFDSPKGFLYKKTVIYNLFEKKIDFTVPYSGKIFCDLESKYFFLIEPLEGFKIVSFKDGKILKKIKLEKEFYSPDLLSNVFFINNKTVTLATFQDLRDIQICEINTNFCTYINIKELFGERVDFFFQFIHDTIANEIIILVPSNIVAKEIKKEGITIKTVHWHEDNSGMAKKINNLLIVSTGIAFYIYKIEEKELTKLWSTREIVLRHNAGDLGYIFDFNINKKIIAVIEGQKKIRFIKTPEDIWQ